MARSLLLTLVWLVFASFLPAMLPALLAEEPARPTDRRLKLELFAEAPQIVTPTGIAVTAEGRVLVIESNTHFPPEGYTGAATDRILSFVDANGDGRAEAPTVFYEGLTHAMNLNVHPHDGSVYVATRSEVFRLQDLDGDGRAEERTPIARLDTKGNYPHNGLSGFAFDFAGNVYFGLGENLGADYRLIGTDETGGGEGGNIYACAPDGRNLRLVATGFWNPFHLCFDTFGRLFAVDNDPDSRPPCRLLHIVEDGDYGYRFRNGRKGLHPFTAWNGELPGTLPMVSGTGEAPSGVLAYESDHLPEDYRGTLLCTSWGDHRIDAFRLTPRGASFVSSPQPIVVGGENFRPVGIALAPDGSLYISDWVDKSYQLHGKGRVWRLSAARPPQSARPSEPEAAVRSLHQPLREHAARQLAASEAGKQALERLLKSPDERTRAVALEALHAAGAADLPWFELFLNDPAAGVRLTAARIGAQRLKASETNLPSAAAAALAKRVRSGPPDEALLVFVQQHPGGAAGPQEHEVAWAESADPFPRRTVVSLLKRQGQRAASPQWTQATSAPVRLAALLALRETALEDPAHDERLTAALSDADPDVRFSAVQWVGESRRKTFRPLIADGLSTRATTRRLFEGYLAALALLDGESLTAWDEKGLDPYIADLVTSDKTSPAVRRRALRMLRADHPSLTVEVLRGLLASDDPQMQLEAVRSLRERSDEPARALLLAAARNASLSTVLRAEALSGLNPAITSEAALLWELLDAEAHPLVEESLRTLRGSKLTPAQTERLKKLSQQSSHFAPLADLLLKEPPSQAEAPPADAIERWVAQLDEVSRVDPAAGERIFFHSRVAGCANCHQMEGRGGRVGPELTATAQLLKRRRLVESILRPSQEIAPQFTAWTIVTTDGRTILGTLVSEAVDGTQTFADSTGKQFALKPSEIEAREAAPRSIMPDGLHQRMTLQELADLLAYLQEER